MKKQVIIVGGGASGLVAAIAAARQGAEVLILERMNRVGKKILSTGNGRCNMTNLSLRPECFNSSQKTFPMKVLDKFSMWDTLTFFDEIGIVTKNKNGYIYPNSEQAAAVADTLKLEAERLGVRILCECRVETIEKRQKRGFFLTTSQGEFTGNAVILAAGSKAYPVLGSDGSGYELAKALGHEVIEPLPALVALRCKGKQYKQMAGVRCEASLKLQVDQKTVASDTGELQITEYGLSGIPVFQISRFASVALYNHRNVTVLVDFFQSKNQEDLSRFLRQRAKRMEDRLCRDFLTGVLNSKLAGVILTMAGIRPDDRVADIKSSQWAVLVKQLKAYEAVVTATNSFDQAQVCCGGVDTRQIRPETMESRLVPGLYVTGELLDVDGICGGYNLQWAWSTGTVAGRCAGRT